MSTTVRLCSECPLLHTCLPYFPAVNSNSQSRVWSTDVRLSLFPCPCFLRRRHYTRTRCTWKGPPVAAAGVTGLSRGCKRRCHGGELARRCLPTGIPGIALLMHAACGEGAPQRYEAPLDLRNTVVVLLTHRVSLVSAITTASYPRPVPQGKRNCNPMNWACTWKRSVAC